MGTPTAVQLQARCQWTNSHSRWHAWSGHHSFQISRYHLWLCTSVSSENDFLLEELQLRCFPWSSSCQPTVWDLQDYICFSVENDAHLWCNNVGGTWLCAYASHSQLIFERGPIGRTNLLKFLFFVSLWKTFNGILEWASDTSILNSNFQCRLKPLPSVTKIQLLLTPDLFALQPHSYTADNSWIILTLETSWKVCIANWIIQMACRSHKFWCYW